MMRNFQPKGVSSKPESLSPDHVIAWGVCFEHLTSKGVTWCFLTYLHLLAHPVCERGLP